LLNGKNIKLYLLHNNNNNNNNNNIDWRMKFDRVNWTKLMQILKEPGTA